MKKQDKTEHPPEVAETLEQIKTEIRERMKYDDFNFMEVEEIFSDFGLEPDYIFDVLEDII